MLLHALAHKQKLESKHITVKYNIALNTYQKWYIERKQCDF